MVTVDRAGSVGSTYYTDHLTREELARIKIYFNYDMIGSPNPSYEVSRGREVTNQKTWLRWTRPDREQQRG